MADLEIIKATLHYSLKSPQADHRQGIIRAVKALVSRMSEAARVGVREVGRLEKKKRVLEQDLAKLAKVMPDLQNELKLADIKLKIADTARAIADHSGPGRDFDRMCAWLSAELQTYVDMKLLTNLFLVGIHDYVLHAGDAQN